MKNCKVFFLLKGSGSYPLEKLYSISTHLKEALSEKVWLKNGGYLIIQKTEAMTVIDVNSGKGSEKK